MSGIEVAGLVLGSIPLLISALEHYADGVSTIQRWRKYDQERKSLIRQLKTQSMRMQNVCELLITGLVPPSLVDSMIKDPAGSFWRSENFQRKLRARLCDSLDVFEATVVEMRDAILEMRKRLGLSLESQVSSSHFCYVCNHYNHC